MRILNTSAPIEVVVGPSAAQTLSQAGKVEAHHPDIDKVQTKIFVWVEMDQAFSEHDVTKVAEEVSRAFGHRFGSFRWANLPEGAVFAEKAKPEEFPLIIGQFVETAALERCHTSIDRKVDGTIIVGLVAYGDEKSTYDGKPYSNEFKILLVAG